jgi:hypothetical protein
MRKGAVRLLREEVQEVTSTGPLQSIQSAEVLPAGGEPADPNPRLLERAGDAYWRLVGRRFAGVIRAVPDGRPAVVLLTRRIPLLRFGQPRYEPLERGGSISWPIRDGLLVSREGREHGFLRLSIERNGGGEASALRATIEVHDFYPSIRSRGRMAGWLGTRLYGATQRRIHRSISRAFLRSLAHTDLSG